MKISTLDDTTFGVSRYLMDDTQDEIPTYGGIFKGRIKTFSVDLVAPSTPGTFLTHWGMIQEGVTWFGDTLILPIEVSATTGLENKDTLNASIDIFPNPLETKGTLVMNGKFTKGDKIILIAINGKKIHQKTIQTSGETVNIDFQKINIQEGVYFIQVKKNNAVIAKKLIVIN